MDDMPMPPVARLLGWTFVSADPEAGEIEIAFDGKPAFANPAGFIQGGLLTAMMDDAMGPAALIKSNGERYTSSIDLHTHFLRPVRPGLITVKARVTQMGQRVAFLEAQLFDAAGRLCARATSSASLGDVPKPAATP